MRLDWRLPLNGVLAGSLPMPGFSVDAFIQARMFHRPAAQIQPLPNDLQAIKAGQVFGRHSLPVVERQANDMQAIQSARVFARSPSPQQGMSPGWLMAFAASC